MKKTWKRICATVLCVVTLCASAYGCIGCNRQKQNTDDNTTATEKRTFEGTHIYTTVETDMDLVKNGKTDYVVVLPENLSESLISARDELIYFFEEATGIRLSAFSDAEATAFSNKKYISIGETQQFANSGFSLDKDRLTSDGHHILTDDDGNVYLIGGADTGSLSAVYTFLRLTFDWECYYIDCYEINRNVRNLKLLDYQVTDIPDFTERWYDFNGIYGQGSSYDELNFGNRMQMYADRGNSFMPVYKVLGDNTSATGKSTNADYYFPEEIYNNPEKAETYHPKWYSTKSTSAKVHFCYTARGDESEYRAMVEECAKKIEFSLEQFPRELFPQYKAITMTTQDNNALCTCSACLEAEAKYEWSGVILRYINDVADLVAEWMEKPENEPYKRENFPILIFAYQEYSLPPVTYDETEKIWKPIDETVVCRDNVGIYLAPAYNFAWRKEVYHEENKEGRDLVEGWAVVADKVWLWTYGTNFNNYMYIYDSYSFYNSEGYQYLASIGANGIVTQHQSGNGRLTAWHNLKMYLNAKLQWNCNADTQELTDNFFNAMYGDATELMKNAFYAQCGYAGHLYDSLSLYTGINWSLPFKDKNNWPLAMMESWVDAFDEAISALNENAPNYETCWEHIELEAVSPIWIALNFYGGDLGEMSTQTKTAYKTRLSEDVARLGLGVMKTSEHEGVVTDILN